jgi:hypothetical protein
MPGQGPNPPSPATPRDQLEPCPPPDIPQDNPAAEAPAAQSEGPHDLPEETAPPAEIPSPTIEEQPMLEVHAPHEPIRSWKDFLIHIAAIAVGLLLAIGLEQAVEAIQSNHERHQLESDLHAEGIRNDAILARDLRLLAIKRADSVALRNQVEARLRGGAEIALPDLPLPNNEDTFKPSEGVWSSARDSAQLALLPRELAEMYEELYSQPQWTRDFTMAWFSAADNLHNFENQFPARTPSGYVDLSKLTPDQLNQYSDLLTRLITQNESLASVLDFYARENRIVLNGATSGEELHEKMVTHP